MNGNQERVGLNNCIRFNMRLFSEKTSLLLEAKLEKFNPKNKSEQKDQLSVLSGTIASVDITDEPLDENPNANKY